MCFGSNTTTTVQGSEIPEYITNFGEQISTGAVNYGMPNGEFNPYPQFDPQTYQPMGEALTAQFNPWHDAGFGMAGAAATSYQPFLNNASSYGSPQLFGGSIDSGQFGQVADSSQYTSGNTVGDYNTQNLQTFMNPYQDMVVDQGMQELARQNQILQLQNDDAASSAGAFGGSRHGILGAETNRNYFDQANNFLANTLNTGFNNAQQARLAEAGLGYQDANLGLQDIAQNRASYLGNVASLQGDFDRTLDAYQTNLGALQQGLQSQLALGDAAQNFGFQGANALTAVGDAYQNRDQQVIDAARGEQLGIENYPYELSNTLMGIISGTPYSQQTTTTSNDGSNGFLNALGLGLGALFSSDEELKEDKKKLKKKDKEDVLDKFKKINLYDYKYKDEARVKYDLPERRKGVMAQQWNEIFDLDEKRVDGDLHVDVADTIGNMMIAIQALAEKVDKPKRKAA